MGSPSVSVATFARRCSGTCLIICCKQCITESQSSAIKRHSESRTRDALWTSLHHRLTVPLAHAQWAVEKWWSRRKSSASCCTTAAVKREPRSDISQSIIPSAEIHWLNAFTAASLSGLLYGNNQLYEVRSSFMTSTYFRSASFAGPLYKMSICTTSLGCCPWSAVDNGLGICSPALVMILCIQFCTKSLTSVAGFSRWKSVTMMFSVTSLSRCPLAPQALW